MFTFVFFKIVFCNFIGIIIFNHLAHYHSEKVEEKGGVIFRWLPSITGTDTWSNDCGYIGAVKRSYSFVYDKDKGLIQINSTIVE